MGRKILNLTDEERKERRAKQRKKYRESNKEKIAKRRREYYEANKERIKQYKTDNREKISEYGKKYRASKKHKPVVYLLPQDNYVGTTEDLHHRIFKHKKAGRNIDNYRILGEFDNREDALEVEGLLHDLGCNGKHKFNSYQ